MRPCDPGAVPVADARRIDDTVVDAGFEGGPHGALLTPRVDDRNMAARAVHVRADCASRGCVSARRVEGRWCSCRAHPVQPHGCEM
jgi:hypothetical protein